jgi:hypothetical protein
VNINRGEQQVDIAESQLRLQGGHTRRMSAEFQQAAAIVDLALQQFDSIRDLGVQLERERGALEALRAEAAAVRIEHDGVLAAVEAAKADLEAVQQRLAAGQAAYREFCKKVGA